MGVSLHALPTLLRYSETVAPNARNVLRLKAWLNLRRLLTIVSFMFRRYQMQIARALQCVSNDLTPDVNIMLKHKIGKMLAVNVAIRDIGMGPYQWFLYFVTGLGWMIDNLMIQTLANLLPLLRPEFLVDNFHVKRAIMVNIGGLSTGAFGWSPLGDAIGRRVPFYCTLPTAAISGFAMSTARNWPSVMGWISVLGVGVGGNLPVDGEVFVEFLPPGSSKIIVSLFESLAA